MKRTTIFITEELERDLSAYARRTGRPAASIVREAVASYLVKDAAAHALPSFAGAFDSGHTDTASAHDALLFNTLTPHDPPQRPAKKPRAPKRAVARPGRKRR